VKPVPTQAVEAAPVDGDAVALDEAA
jgi:hypothetical protein